VFEEEELERMTVTKYDERSGSPYEYHYAGRFDFEEAEYAVFYPVKEDYLPPVVLRIEGRRFFDIVDLEEEQRLFQIVEELEESEDQEQENETRQ
jgi:hypothetical protein